MAGADIRRYSIDRHGTSLNAPLAVLAAALLAFADALLYPVLMLPVLLVQLTDNLTTVGFVVALTGGLWFIPQIIAAGVIQDRRRVKPVLLAGGMTRVAALGFFTSIGFRASEFTNQQLLRWFVLAIIISTIASAFSARPLTIMTGRAVASEQQRRVFGGRGVLGSLLAIIGGWVILSLFATDGPVFPRNLTLLVLAAASATAVGTFFAGLIREPRRMRRVAVPRLGESISGAVRMLGDRAFRRFALYRSLLALATGVEPFLIIYGIEQLVIPLSIIGEYLILLIAARAIADPVWSWIASRSGHRSVLQGATAVRLVAPGVALLLPALTATSFWQNRFDDPALVHHLFGLVFVSIGAALAGQIRGSFGYLNEIVPADQRYHAANQLNTILMVLAFVPVIAGAIAHQRGLETIIAASAILVLLALLLSGALINASTTIRRSSVVTPARLRASRPVR